MSHRITEHSHVLTSLFPSTFDMRSAQLATNNLAIRGYHLYGDEVVMSVKKLRIDTVCSMFLFLPDNH